MMYKCNNVNFLICLLLVVLSFNWTAPAMGDSNNKILTVVTPKGWKIVSEAQERAAKFQSRESKIDLSGVVVTVRSSRIEDDYFTVIDDYFLQPNHEMRVHRYDVSFYSLAEFTYNGRTFGVKIEMVIGDAATKTKSGAIVTYCFLDRDGDGILETRQEKEKIGMVPDWVIRKS